MFLIIKNLKKNYYIQKIFFIKRFTGYLICKILDKILNKKINFKMENISY